jgi:4-amino-4-deoxy-L-arabinose transferase-like glycosyltransferase
MRARASRRSSIASFTGIGRRVSLHVRRHGAAYGLAVVVAVTAAAVALTAQGWRSRIPTFDLLTYIRSAHELLDTGALPDHGDVGSYGSFSPPGTAWLMVPSALLFDDPRLSEYAGTALLHGATLLGLFLLGRKFFGVWCGCLAALLYGLSDVPTSSSGRSTSRACG